MYRQSFLPSSKLFWCGWLLGGLISAPEGGRLFATERPNILWISCEDMGCDLGCYGVSYARTPHIDQLAQQGVKFTRCFTHAGVCAPSRSGLITGMYPPSIGSHHMRCQAVTPAGVRCFTEYLRQAGYYCTNNVKTDYQFDVPASAWDENSNQADWRGRAPGQPFFCVINFTTTHESQIRNPRPETQRLLAQLPEHQRHDPSQVPLPAYYPDSPVIRRDVARYFDLISAMDRQVGEVLARLEADGLSEDTIVWFWSDHGRGLPRHKRWLYDSGIHVPLIIRVPEKWRRWAYVADPGRCGPGAEWNDLVAFVDFAPTVLSLAGIPLPSHLQGQAFLGPQAQPPRQYIYAHRDRMDETYDLIRSVRDQRFHYIRNFRFELPYAQRIAYGEEMPTLREWRRLACEGKLQGASALFFSPRKPVEELYDTWHDPDEVHNLASHPDYQETLRRLRAECLQWMQQIGDAGLIPEPEFDAWQRPDGRTPQVPAPRVWVTRGDEHQPLHVELFAEHPALSLVFQRGPEHRAWQLYQQPITIDLQQTLRVKAVRAGWRDSPTITVSQGQVAPSAPTLDASAPLHEWRERLVTSTLLPELFQLLQAQLEEEAVGMPRCAQALQSEHAPVRYWAWLIMRQRWPERLQHPDWKTRLQAARDHDVSPSVRIWAAETLAQLGETEPSLQVLRGYLQPQPHESLRLAALTALKHLGEQARPLIPEIEPLVNGSEYVSRVAEAILHELTGRQLTPR
ncbi:MAG: hypothetical protein KatS3mg113_0527 [Planctomycetaceae bacterium]|nr:MAG: hypothetical protein KatS3mg113_0527 [Planctomycetaceae bacterium]